MHIKFLSFKAKTLAEDQVKIVNSHLYCEDVYWSLVNDCLYYECNNGICVSKSELEDKLRWFMHDSQYWKNNDTAFIEGIDWIIECE